MRSVHTAARIQQLAGQIGVRRTFVVTNKISRQDERERLEQALSGQIILGTLPYDPQLARADLEGRPIELTGGEFGRAVEQIGETLERQLGDRPTPVG